TLAEYQRVKRFTRTALPKATLPTPSAFHFFRFTQPFDPAVYDQQRYFDDLVAVYRTELAELAQTGRTYVQMGRVPRAGPGRARRPRQAFRSLHRRDAPHPERPPGRRDRRHASLPRQLPQPLDG